jgi:PRTRC genetic system ThiF family protein
MTRHEKWLPPAFLLDHPVKVLVIGAGGTGSQVAQGLAPLHMALTATGHPGLEVLLMDPAVVREANIGRQPYYPADVGHPKAAVLATRINAQYASVGFQMAAVVSDDIARVAASAFTRHNVLIGCVDTKAARAKIAACVNRTADCVWIDCGNRADDGQVVMGTGPVREMPYKVPHVADLYPEIVDTSTPEDNTPSCSMVEALEKQSLYVNRETAIHALDLLARWLREGLTHHARIFNLASGRMNSIPLDETIWANFGYKPRAPKQKAKRKEKIAA